MKKRSKKANYVRTDGCPNRRCPSCNRRWEQDQADPLNRLVEITRELRALEGKSHDSK